MRFFRRRTPPAAPERLDVTAEFLSPSEEKSPPAETPLLALDWQPDGHGSYTITLAAVPAEIKTALDELVNKHQIVRSKVCPNTYIVMESLPLGETNPFYEALNEKLRSEVNALLRARSVPGNGGHAR